MDIPSIPQNVYDEANMVYAEVMGRNPLMNHHEAALRAVVREVWLSAHQNPRAGSTHVSADKGSIAVAGDVHGKLTVGGEERP